MSTLLHTAKNTICKEIAALTCAMERLGTEFDQAVHLILAAPGKVLVSGLGKSGIIGSKIAATLASTGTPAVFLHPVDALHGDFGVVQRGDIAVLISKSGETPEVIDLLQVIKPLGLPSIGIIGKCESTLGRQCCVTLDASVESEACPLNLAPTSSTTVAVALGDALAACLIERRGFTPTDFARCHPAGSLGKRLLLRVRDIMHAGEELPLAQPGVSVTEALLTMTAKPMGAVVVVSPDRRLLGIFTDGDARRLFTRNGDMASKTIEQVMTRDPVVVHEHELAARALELMEKRASQISVLPVTRADNTVVGVVRIHDLVQAGL
jgi:arabinose-5-phosphate isomerase